MSTRQILLGILLFVLSYKSTLWLVALLTPVLIVTAAMGGLTK